MWLLINVLFFSITPTKDKEIDCNNYDIDIVGQNVCYNKSQGHLCDPCDCSAFFICGNVIHHYSQGHCGPGTFWNSQSLVCDLEANVDCTQCGNWGEFTERTAVTNIIVKCVDDLR